MLTLHYTFDDEQFDYDIDRYDMEQRLFDWLYENWTSEECVEYILSLDGCQVSLFDDFNDLITELFEDEAEECWYDSKHSDNGVDDEDFI